MHIEPTLGMCLKMANNCMEQYINGKLNSRNLTGSQLHLLLWLGEQPEGAATMKEMERVFRVAQSTVCGIVSRMEKKGLLEDAPLPGDRRVKRIRLTDAGRELRGQCISDFDAAESWLTESLSQDEASLLKGLLRKICDDKRTHMPDEPRLDHDPDEERMIP